MDFKEVDEEDKYANERKSGYTPVHQFFARNLGFEDPEFTIKALNAIHAKDPEALMRTARYVRYLAPTHHHRPHHARTHTTH